METGLRETPYVTPAVRWKGTKLQPTQRAGNRYTKEYAMSLVRFDVSSEVDDLRREVNRMFAGFPHLPFFGQENGMSRWMPPMDTVEEKGKLKIMLDLPGVDEKDVDVEVDGDMLTIRGTRKIEREDTGQQWYRYERSSGSFERCLQMPDGIDAAKVKATFDKGVLTVELPTAKKVAAASKHIAITGAKG